MLSLLRREKWDGRFVSRSLLINLWQIPRPERTIVATLVGHQEELLVTNNRPRLPGWNVGRTWRGLLRVL